MAEQAPTPAVLGEAGEVAQGEGDLDVVLLGTLDWYRDRLLRKLDGLDPALAGTTPGPLTWAPTGLVRHLTWVERRWFAWGFAAADVAGFDPGGEAAEWAPGADALAGWHLQVAVSRTLVAGVPLGTRSRLGGRFTDPATAPTLGRVVVHVLQEYARHLGQLDVARELLDGATGE